MRTLATVNGIPLDMVLEIIQARPKNRRSLLDRLRAGLAAPAKPAHGEWYGGMHIPAGMVE